MTSAVFAIPGDIGLPTGGYGYDRRVLALLPDFGIHVRHLPLPGSFPVPTAVDLAETSRALHEIDPNAVLLIDGLAFGAMPVTLIDSLPNPILALVHHPLCLEAGLTEERAAALFRSEKAALARARRIAVTSPITAALLTAEYAVPQDRIAIAVPGTDPASRARGTATPLQLLAVGSVIPRKAHDSLVRALAPLRHRDWRLSIVGALDHRSALAALQGAIEQSGLAGRVTLAGPASGSEMASFYAAADLFVTASLYEGYGMALAEALARGLPIVCTTGGASSQTVPDAAALKVAPGDERALSVALARALDDPALLRRLGDAAWAAARSLARWEDTARIVAGVIRGIAP